MQKKIFPSQIKDNAEINVPSSKSLSHRALIAASLAEGTSHIHHLSENKDTEATQRVLSHLGVSFTDKKGEIIVRGISSLHHYDGAVLDCGESGSTLRFLIPLFSLTGEEVIFLGRGRLMKRPQSVYEEIFRKNHLRFDFIKDTLHIQGTVPSGNYEVRGDVSSQFISGLLFALPLLEKDSLIQVEEPFESRSYVTLTLEMLEKAGIRIDCSDTVFHIPGSQKYHSFSYTVDGDDSQAAFFAELALIHKKPVILHHLNHFSKQGDHILFDIIQKMGGFVSEIPDGYIISCSKLKGCEIDLADCPDLGPALFALATQCEGQTVFRHIQRLRLKESDRVEAMEEELGKLGCSIMSDEDTVIVNGITPVRGNVVLNSHNDHRIAMALSVLASTADQPVIIDEAETVAKSYPDFYDDLAETGVKVI